MFAVSVSVIPVSANPVTGFVEACTTLNFGQPLVYQCKADSPGAETVKLDSGGVIVSAGQQCGTVTVDVGNPTNVGEACERPYNVGSNQSE